MKITPIIEALRERAAIFSGRVAGACEFAPLSENSTMSVPTAYVIPMDDNPGENKAQNGYWQENTESFAVVVIVSNTADERGQSAIDHIHDCRKQLFSALIGWSPDEAYDGIVYEGGTLIERNRAHLYYQFEFSSKTDIEDDQTWIAVRNNELPDFDSVDGSGESSSGQEWGVDLIDPGNGPDGHIEHQFHFKPE